MHSALYWLQFLMCMRIKQHNTLVISWQVNGAELIVACAGRSIMADKQKQIYSRSLSYIQNKLSMLSMGLKIAHAYSRNQIWEHRIDNKYLIHKDKNKPKSYLVINYGFLGLVGVDNSRSQILYNLLCIIDKCVDLCHPCIFHQYYSKHDDEEETEWNDNNEREDDQCSVTAISNN